MHTHSWIPYISPNHPPHWPGGLPIYSADESFESTVARGGGAALTAHWGWCDCCLAEAVLVSRLMPPIVCNPQSSADEQQRLREEIKSHGLHTTTYQHLICHVYRLELIERTCMLYTQNGLNVQWGHSELHYNYDLTIFDHSYSVEWLHRPWNTSNGHGNWFNTS